MFLRDIWTCCRYPREVYARTEKKAECEATVVNHADVLSLFDIFRQVMSDLACRDIRHADVDGCHQADGRRCLNQKDSPCREMGDVSLTLIGSCRIGTVWVGKTGDSGLREICTINNLLLDNLSIHRGVPAVVRRSIQKGLIQCTADEVFCQTVVSHHLRHRIWLAL